MPDIYRHTVDKLGMIIDRALIKTRYRWLHYFLIQKKQKKMIIGSEALNEENLVCKAIRIY